MKFRVVHIPLLMLTVLVSLACSNDAPPSEPTVQHESPVTFYEIGADHCEPCKLMRPIMKSLQKKYGEKQLTVIFLDVFTQKAEADQFRIRVMPTQVFLDENGVEFHRHEGFYPEAEIDSLLQERGLRILIE